jgi:PAS domain-containing protein
VTSRSTRRAVFGEWQQRLRTRWILTAGVRRDASTLTDARTLDPRVSLAGRLGPLGLTAAWGRHHQVAEPTFRRGTVFAPMRADHWLAGLQLGGDTVGLRLELYDKSYRDLWQMTPDFEPVGGGIGSARGLDLQLRWRFSTASRSRLAWSHVRARRTDPVSGREAPTLADVTHSITWITDRTWRFLTVSSAFRYASGRPFTDIVGTTLVDGRITPVNGDPFGARLPAFLRSDLSASWYRALGERRGLVLWGSLSNVFDRSNVMRYRWSADYRVRTPVRAPFNRSLFLGTTLLF